MSNDPRTYSRAVPARATVAVDDLAESRRRAIFAAVRKALATGQKAWVARYAVAKQYVVTVLTVEAIEQEGLDKGWGT